MQKISVTDLINFLNKQPKIIIIILGFVLVLFIGIIDFITGYRIGLSIFYLGPIIMLCWLSGRRSGVILSCFAVVVWFFAEDLARPEDFPNFIIYWNATIRLSFFLIIVYVLDSLKLRLEKEKQMSMKDYLTGIANSRFFFDLADMELSRMKRHKEVFSAAYIDVDNFKTVNDDFGHKAGDLLLRTVADIIKKSTREIDIVARLGGDEFIVIMPLTNEKQALITVQRIQKNLNDVMNEKNWPVSFSFGVVAYINPPNTVDEVIHMSDSLMYSAKKSGKNKIEIGTFE